jgi:hypothetical protein
MALAAFGCSTVIKTSSEDYGANAPERAALIDAAADVAWSPWPKPSSSSIAERLAGGEAPSDGVSRDDAVDAYVVAVKAAPDGEAAVLDDAGKHLDAARALNAAADDACDSAYPRLSDVALLEDAIADLRETRTIYVATLKKIDGDDDAIDRLKRDFDRALKDLGDVADKLAENAMKKRADNFAGPDPSSVTSGSF